MTVSKWLAQATAKLDKAGISSARLDCLILPEDSQHKDRAWLLANPDSPLQGRTLKTLSRKLERRANHEPLAYIRGFTEFYGRKFKINRHVLEPRPESETMIELLKQLVDSGQLSADRKSKTRNYKLATNNLFIADVGCGCGAIGITAALEIPDARVDLYDISAGALAVTRANEHIHELRLHARKMNLLARPLTPYDVILANLPYVPNDWKINESAMAEPKIAIFGGKDGLDLYRKLFAQLDRFTWKPKFVLTETLPPQHSALEQVAVDHGYRLKKTQDFIQIFQNT